MTYYWFGGTGNWSDYTNHWSLNSGNSPASLAPAAPDNTIDVRFDANSFTGASQVVTIDAGANRYCASMDWTGATNNPTLTFSGQPLRAYGNVTFILAMTITGLNQLRIYGNPCNMTTNGVSITFCLTIVSGGLTLLDNYISNYIVSFESGTFITNGHTITCGSFGLTSVGVKTFTPGASAINCTSYVYDGTNLTLTAPNTSSIYVTGTGAFTGGTPSGSYGYINLNGTAHTVSGTFTCIDLTRNGTATKTDTVTFTSGNTITCTGRFRPIGSSATNRLLMQSSTLGSPATIVGLWSSLTLNVDIMDITADAGTNLSTYSSGDCGGNTNITFTTSAAQTSSKASTWSDSTMWTSRVPLPQDDVTCSHNVTVDMPRIGKSITFTGTPTVSLSNNIENYGSFTLVSGLTYTHNSKENYFRGRGSFTLTTGGKTLYRFREWAPTGTLTLQDDLTVTTYLQNPYGVLDFNGKNVTAGFIGSSYSTTRSLLLGSGTITLNGTTDDQWNLDTTTNLTFNAGTSTIVLTRSTTGAHTFYGGALAYNNITVQGAGSYALTITKNNTFNVFTVDRSQANKSIITTGTTQTVSNFVCATSGTYTLTINGGTWTKTGGGRIGVDYIALYNSTASPANTFFACPHLYGGASNTGWRFLRLPLTTPRFRVRDFGSCGQFNGTDDYADISADILGIGATTNWSIEVYAKFLGTAYGLGNIITVATDTSNYILLGTNGSNVYWSVYKTGNTTRRQKTNDNAITKGRWYHVIVTKTGDSDVVVYVNGVLNTTRTNHTDDTGPSAYPKTILGRQRAGGDAAYFCGTMDEVRVYNRALTQAEVTQRYYQATELATGNPVSYWKLDENTGTTIADSIGSNTLTWGGTGTHWSTNVVFKPRFRERDMGNCGIFNGTDDYVDMGNVLNLGTADFTIETWAKFSGVIPVDQFLISKYQDGNYRWYLRANNGYFYGMVAKVNGATVVDTRATPASDTLINDNKWHHLVLSCVRGGLGRMFVDGREVSHYEAQTCGVTDLTNTGLFQIGNYNGTYYQGSQDEVRVYNRALTVTEILSRYYQGLELASGNPISYWKLDEGTGTSVADSIGTNTGTWNGTGGHWSNQVMFK